MKIFGRIALASSLLVGMAIPAMAGVTIANPAQNADVESPFNLSASASTCSSQNVTAMGYSFDSSADASNVNGTSLNLSLSASPGAHTLHVKAWGDKGSVCVADVSISVKSGNSSSTSGSDSAIPANAISVSDVQALSGWKGEHDNGGQGSSSGSSSMVSSPSLYGGTRQFVTSFQDSGDERYSVTFADDTNAQNFFYDAWVYFTSSVNQVANLELDVNQTMANGQTVLIGVQCDGYSGQWAYTVNQGSASNPQPHWVSKSGTSCNVRKWSTNTWHHVQASYSRDDSGTITYHSVWVDGVENKLNATAFGAADLGWGPIINTQFQVDGLGSSGQTTVYLDKLTISRW